MDALDAFSGDYSELLNQKALAARVPFSGTFELLPYCNMRCKMCYIVHENAGSTRERLQDISFWKETIQQAIDHGMLYMVITGGEPFLYPQIRELLEWLHTTPVHYVINTNGTLLDEETVRWLKQVSPGRLNISMYGASNETYARLCGNPQGFTQLTRAFALLKQYEIPYRVHTTLTPDNYCDYEKIIEVCNQHQCYLQMVYYMFPPYRKDQGLIENQGRFTPEKAAEVAIRLQRDRVKDPVLRLQQLEHHCAAFENPAFYSLYGQNTISCRGGYASFWVDWGGHISGCGIHTAEKIDLSKTAFADAWKQIVANTEAVRISETCAYCRYRCICPVCVAAAYCETGDVAGTPEYLCRFSEHFAKLIREEAKLLKNECI